MNSPETTYKQSKLSPLAPDFLKVGFVGQGWIGRNYADDFERRGFNTVRYSLEEPYRHNKARIQECRIVFVAVPTPTTPNGFDVSILKEAITNVAPGAIVVLKSTIVPGTTVELQKEFSNHIVLYAPEFLSEATAAYDAQNPFSNIIGLSVDDETHRIAAEEVLAILPRAPFQLVCTSTEAEFVKYTHNMSGYVQIVLFNALYDAARELGADWTPINKALKADPFISSRYSQPVHKSGRGAGGGCFIKDFAAFRELYQTLLPNDTRGLSMLLALEQKNIELLHSSNKDSALLKGVYGDNPLAAAARVDMVEHIMRIPRRVQLVAFTAGLLAITAGTLDIAARFISAILR